MPSKLIQRHSWLTLCLSVLFIAGYMHEIAAQYQEHHHCGSASEASVKPGAGDACDMFQSGSLGETSTDGDSPYQGPSSEDCLCTHCSPVTATLSSAVSRTSAIHSCSRLIQGSLLKPTKLSGGIDHPPNQG